MTSRSANDKRSAEPRRVNNLIDHRHDVRSAAPANDTGFWAVNVYLEEAVGGWRGSPRVEIALESLEIAKRFMSNNEHPHHFDGAVQAQPIRGHMLVKHQDELAFRIGLKPEALVLRPENVAKLNPRVLFHRLPLHPAHDLTA